MILNLVEMSLIKNSTSIDDSIGGRSSVPCAVLANSKRDREVFQCSACGQLVVVVSKCFKC